MSNKIKLILCSIIIFLSSVSEAKFVTTYSVNSPVMQEIGQWADKDTIVFVNLDDTLMMPKSLMFSYNSNPYCMFIDNMISLGERMHSYNIIVSKWYQQRQVKLVEDGWVDFIKKLQGKGAVVYGFCSMPIHLVNIEEKRYLEAKDFDIIFTSKINGKEVLEIEKQERWYSFFHKGIIFTGPYSKSHTLMEFLRVTNVIPKKLVFIDHIEHEVKRVEQSLRVFDMEYYNILYLGVKEVPGKPDVNVIKLQQQELIQNGVWMEDDAARALLSTRREESKTSESSK